MSREQSLTKRVCLFPGAIGGGGIGMVMIALAQGLLEQGIAVDLLLAGARLQELEVGRSLPEGVRLVQLSSRARSAMVPLVRYLRREQPDMIIAARDYINLIALLAHRMSGLGQRCSVVWTFHTHRPSQRQSMRKTEGILDRLMLANLHRVDARVAVSDGIAADLAEASGLSRDRFHVIDNPGWTSARAADANLDCAHPWLMARKPGQRDRTAPVLLGIGRLVGQKDFATLINAFSIFSADHPQARLIILGEGEDRENLISQVKRLGLEGAVDLAGHVANAPSYLARADLFVLSSRWEGQPLALIEALGCGCPVVSTDCPTGPADILRGGLGALVPPGDPIALAQEMARAIDDPVDPALLRAAAARFGAERAVAAYLSLAGQQE